METPKSVEMDEFGRWEWTIEAIHCEILERLRDRSRGEAMQRLQLTLMNNQLLELELGEQSRPLSRFQSALEFQFRQFGARQE